MLELNPEKIENHLGVGIYIYILIYIYTYTFVYILSSNYEARQVELGSSRLHLLIRTVLRMDSSIRIFDDGQNNI